MALFSYPFTMHMQTYWHTSIRRTNLRPPDWLQLFSVPQHCCIEITSLVGSRASVSKIVSPILAQRCRSACIPAHVRGKGNLTSTLKRLCSIWTERGCRMESQQCPAVAEHECGATVKMVTIKSATLRHSLSPPLVILQKGTFVNVVHFLSPVGQRTSWRFCMALSSTNRVWSSKVRFQSRQACIPSGNHHR